MIAKSVNAAESRAFWRWGMTLLVAGFAVAAGCACPRGTAGAGNPIGHDGQPTAGVKGQEPRVPAVQLPENFPKDVPVMPGLAQAGAGESDNARGTGRVTLVGKIKRQEIVAYYSNAMKDAGWSEDENRADGANWLMVYTRDRLKTTITVSGDAAGSTVDILYETQQ